MGFKTLYFLYFKKIHVRPLRNASCKKMLVFFFVSALRPHNTPMSHTSNALLFCTTCLLFIYVLIGRQTRQGRLELWDVGTRSCLTFLDTKTTALAHVCGVGKNVVKALQLPSSSTFLCATTSKAHDAVNVYDVLGPSRRGKPVIETTPLSSAQVPGGSACLAIWESRCASIR